VFRRLENHYISEGKKKRKRGKRRKRSHTASPTKKRGEKGVFHSRRRIRFTSLGGGEGKPVGRERKTLLAMKGTNFFVERRKGGEPGVKTHKRKGIAPSFGLQKRLQGQDSPGAE